MVKSINLSKNNSFDLTKKGGSFNLTKPENTNTFNFKQKTPKPSNKFEPNFTDPLENLEKIDIPLLPFDLYYTPDKVVDPQDCDKYPNSPWCGGFPISPLPIGIEPEIVLDGCNIGISIQPVLFFIKLPQQQIFLKHKSCIKIAVQEPALPNDTNYDEKVFIPPHDPASQKIVIIYQDKATGFSESEYTGAEDPYYFFTASSHETLEILDVEFPYLGSVTFLDGIQKIGSTDPRALKASARVKYKVTRAYSSTETAPFNYSATGDLFIDPTRRREEALVNDPIQVWVNNYAVFEHIDRTIRNTHNLNTYSGSDGYSIDETMFHWTVFIKEIDPSPKNNPPPPPLIKLPNPKILPPPPPEDMNCCPQIIALLQHLIIKVNKLSTIVGVDEFPALLPKSLVSKDEGFLGNFISGFDDQIEIQNLSQLAAHQIKYFDELMGQWEIPIEIKDSDPTKPGDQPVGIKLPNLAEAVAEMMGLLLQTSYNSEALLSINTRNLIETGSDKVQNYKSYMLLQSLVDYVGFKYDEKESTIPLLFTPGKEKLDEMLTESQQKVAVAEFNEKLGLPDDLRKFLEAWSMIKATHFRKVDTAGSAVETAANVMKIIKGLQTNLNKTTEEPEDLPTDDSNDFYETVEQGFTNEANATNTTDPYGRPFAERPKIRQIGID